MSEVELQNNELCPCGSSLPYANCCEIVHNGGAAPTPEAMMRGRYSAFATGSVRYLEQSLYPAHRKDFDTKAVEKWSKESQWLGLEIVKTEYDEKKGFVEFIATYKQDGTVRKHHELAEFKKVEDQWYFWDGKMVDLKPVVREEPKIGRNDPCTCGSGKKYKKCCGK